jgi:Asp-tRNA(Asn)/Glu-tRNA(Gln) amidotransferase C subunit
MEPVTVAMLSSMAKLQGYAWSDAEIEAILPQVARALQLVGQLETLPLSDVEPAIQYRLF